MLLKVFPDALKVSVRDAEDTFENKVRRVLPPGSRQSLEGGAPHRTTLALFTAAEDDVVTNPSTRCPFGGQAGLPGG
jgi:hypothetical protein